MHRPARSLLAVSSSALLCFAVWNLATPDIFLASRLAVGYFLISLAVHTTNAPRQPFTAATVFVFFLGLFHTGILFSLAVGQTPRLFNSVDSQWLSSPNMILASGLYLVAACTFDVVYFAARMGMPSTPRTCLSGSEADAVAQGNRVGSFGAALLSIGVLAWVGVVLATGSVVLGGSYSQFLEQTKGTPLPYVYLLIGLGFPISQRGSATSRRFALLVFVTWAVPAFALGLRGEVLLPAAAYLVVRARNRRVRLRWWFVPILALGLSAGAVIRSARDIGLAAFTGRVDASPLAGLTELGYTIRPVAQVLDWQSYGEPMVGWGTYLNPVVRAFAPYLPLGVPRAVDDPTAFNVVVSERVGQIGGSVIAEAYRAGGLGCLVIIMGALGLVTFAVDRSTPTPRIDFFVGGLTFVLLLWIRNTFVPVPFQVLLLGLLTLVALAISKPHSRASGRRRPTGGITGFTPPLREGHGAPHRSRASHLPRRSVPVIQPKARPRPLLSHALRGGGISIGRNRRTVPGLSHDRVTRGRSNSGIAVSLVAVLNSVFAVLVGVLAARFLGPSGQGKYTLVSTACLFISLIATMGSGTALRIASKPRPTAPAMEAYLFISTLSTIVSAALIPVAIGALPVDHSYGLFFAGTFFGVAMTLGRQAADLLQADGQTGRSLFSLLLATLFQLASFIVLGLASRPSTNLLLVCGGAGFMVQLFYAVSKSRHYRIAFLSRRQRAARAMTRRLIVDGLRSSTFSLGILALQRIDRIILGAVAGVTATGLYATAGTAAEGIRLVPAALGQLLFARVAQEGFAGPARSLYRKGVALLVCSAIIGVMCGPPLLPAIFGSAYASAASMLAILVFAECFMGLALMDSRVLMGSGHLRVVSWASGFLVVLATFAYILVVRQFGAIGAAWATLALYFSYATALFIARSRLVPAA